MNRYHPNTLHSSTDLLFFLIISRSLRVIKNAEELGLNLGSVFGESQRCVLIIDAFLERERDGEKGGRRCSEEKMEGFVKQIRRGGFGG